MRFIQCIFIILVLALTTSCGLVKTVYDNAPAAVSWWLDGYFDFTQSQQAILKPALHQLHDWHRQQQLPVYVGILQGLEQTMMQQQISAAVACEAIEQIKTSFSELQLESIPIVLALAPSLSDQQLQYVQKKLDKRARQWQDEWMQPSPSEQRAVRLEKIEDFAEKIYGSLEPSQHLLLKQDLALAPINPLLTYAEIVRRQEDAYQIITTLKNAALTNQSLSAQRQYQLVKDGFERLQHSPNKRYAAYADKVNVHSCNMIAHLHSSISNKQKQHASELMEKYRLQFSELMPAIKP